MNAQNCVLLVAFNILYLYRPYRLLSLPITRFKFYTMPFIQECPSFSSVGDVHLIKILDGERTKFFILIW